MGVNKFTFVPKVKIALDANIFIYALENTGLSGDKSRDLFAQIKKERPQVVTSVLTIQEVLVGAYKEGLKDKVTAYVEFISGGGFVTIVDFTREIAILSAQIRATHSQIKTPDAIQLATAIHQDAGEFYTADKRLPKKIGKLRIRVL